MPWEPLWDAENIMGRYIQGVLHRRWHHFWCSLKYADRFRMFATYLTWGESEFIGGELFDVGSLLFTEPAESVMNVRFRAVLLQSWCANTSGNKFSSSNYKFQIKPIFDQDEKIFCSTCTIAGNNFGQGPNRFLCWFIKHDQHE